MLQVNKINIFACRYSSLNKWHWWMKGGGGDAGLAQSCSPWLNRISKFIDMDKYFLLLYWFTVESWNLKVISFKTSTPFKEPKEHCWFLPMAGGWDWGMVKILSNTKHSVILWFHDTSIISAFWNLLTLKNKNFTALIFLRKPKSLIFLYHCVLINTIQNTKKRIT